MKTDIWYDAVIGAGIDLDAEHSEWKMVPIIVECLMEDPDFVRFALEDTYVMYESHLVSFVNNACAADSKAVNETAEALNQLLAVVRNYIREIVESRRNAFLNAALERRRELNESNMPLAG